MKHKVIVEIDGVRHKLIKTRAVHICKSCSLSKMCKNPQNGLGNFQPCADFNTHFRKCKPGE